MSAASSVTWLLLSSRRSVLEQDTEAWIPAEALSSVQACVNGYSSAKYRKDDQKYAMETQSFNHLPYLNMTVGVLHCWLPVHTDAFWQLLPGLCLEAEYLNPHNKPKLSRHRFGITQVLTYKYKRHSATAVTVWNATLIEERSKWLAERRKTAPQMNRMKMWAGLLRLATQRRLFFPGRRHYLVEW